MSNGNLQTHKSKFIKKGLIISSTRGEIEFALPRFKEFVQFKNRLREE